MNYNRLLVVSDNPRTNRSVAADLVREGYDVTGAGSLREAAQKLGSFQPGLVILDHPLPGGEADSACLKLRSADPDLPFLILAAKDYPVDRLPGFRLGIDEYQVKPCTPPELVLRVKAVLSRLSVLKSLASQQARELIVYPDLEIDALGRVVRVNMRKVELTNKEFDLLWTLASKPNQVWSRLQLLSRVWNSTFPGDENTVTVHIHRLRGKLERDPAHPAYIKTARGSGYKFEVAR
ncbi:MAG: response regulator transcription factor [Peptococcaceae bacterium]|nr:response regulator transcription factor [Peptococcaceae bacterium]